MQEDLLTKSEARKKQKISCSEITYKKIKEAEILLKLNPFLKNNKHIFIYKADEFEVSVDNLPFLFPEKVFYYPKIISKEEKLIEFISPFSWKPGPYKIPEPIGEKKLTPDQADLIIVPSLGFNKFFYRLGRGGGYYDRALSGIYPKKIIGLSFVELFPLAFREEEFDIKIGVVITENGVIFST